MKYDLIFYISKKTGYCEKHLRRLFSARQYEARSVTFASTPVDLGEKVCDSLRYCPLVIIVGGLRSPYDDNLSTVLSRVLSNSGLTLENMRKLRSSGKTSGYIIRYRNQILLALPDEPRDIDAMLSDSVLRYIEAKTKPE